LAKDGVESGPQIMPLYLVHLRMAGISEAHEFQLDMTLMKHSN